MPRGDTSLTGKARIQTMQVVGGGLVVIGTSGHDQPARFADAGVPSAR